MRQRPRQRSPLFPLKDMEVIIGRMPPTMPLGPRRRAKEDQVLRNTRMNDEHAAHRSSSIVPHPFVAVRCVGTVERGGVSEGEGVGGEGGGGRGEGEGRVDRVGGVRLGEGGEDGGEDGRGVVRVRGDGVLAESMEGRTVEDVPAFLWAVG